MKLFDAGKIISSSLGMAVAMSLSSLFLWKSDWLSVPSGSFHGSHGMGIVIGIVTSAAVMLWCSLSRRSLRRFGMQVVPPIALASLVLSGLPVVQGSAQWVLGIAIPVIGSYTLMFSYVLVVLRCVSARYRGQPHDPALCLGGKLFCENFLRVVYRRGGNLGYFRYPDERLLGTASCPSASTRSHFAHGVELFLRQSCELCPWARKFLA